MTTPTKNKWTGEAVYFYYTTEKLRFAERVPDEAKQEMKARMPKLRKRAPQKYCSTRCEKYNFKWNPNWLTAHCELLAKLLNELGVPTWIMGDLHTPCPEDHTINRPAHHCKVCWGLGRVP